MCPVFFVWRLYIYLSGSGGVFLLHVWSLYLWAKAQKAQDWKKDELEDTVLVVASPEKKGKTEDKKDEEVQKPKELPVEAEKPPVDEKPQVEEKDQVEEKPQVEDKDKVEEKEEKSQVTEKPQVEEKEPVEEKPEEKNDDMDDDEETWETQCLRYMYIYIYVAVIFLLHFFGLVGLLIVQNKSPNCFLTSSRIPRQLTKKVQMILSPQRQLV